MYENYASNYLLKPLKQCVTRPMYIYWQTNILFQHFKTISYLTVDSKYLIQLA